nr:MAG TPA: hypothetical protein [Caudoviricetes sp.]
MSAFRRPPPMLPCPGAVSVFRAEFPVSALRPESA